MKFIISLLLLTFISSNEIQIQSSTKNKNPLLFKLFCKNDIKLYVRRASKETEEDSHCYNVNYADSDKAFDEKKCNDNEYTIESYDLQLKTLPQMYKAYGYKTTKEILKFSECKNKMPTFFDLYFNNFQSKIQIYINLDPKPTKDHSHQFYDEPQAQLVFEDLPHGVTLEYFVQTLNQSPLIGSSKIKLNKNRDLKIESISILKREFKVGFHEILGICAKGEDKKYFFVAHRAAEKGVFTRVKIIYYKRAKINFNCADASPEKIDPNTKLIDAKNSGGCTLYSLKNFLQKSMYYTIDYYYYSISTYNCQHFSTGMYNGMTQEKLKTSNLNFNRVPKIKRLKKLRQNQ